MGKRYMAAVRAPPLAVSTTGWGVDMRMFGILRFVTDSSVVQFLGFFATMLLIVALSMLVGAIQHRWRATGLPPSGTGSAPTLSGSGPNSVLAQRAEVTAG
ncbi:hypothetical protein [Rhodococcus pyridinivorans]|uniref:hypothetical protein n=1 Tax=Rhodococcus pyridinivorans TaxID=103816 RepID=UPI0037C76A4C